MKDLAKQLADLCVEQNITLEELEQCIHNQDEIKPYECAIKLSRVCDIELENIAKAYFMLDDVISFKLLDGEHVEAVVVDVNEHNGKVTFVLKNCFKEKSNMGEMDNFLFAKFLMFPWSLRKIIENRSLRLLNWNEVCGDGRYQYFYNTANRICCDADDALTCWWLGTHSGPMLSELVHPYGDVSRGIDSTRAGVRPVFTIIQKQEG